MSSPPPVALQIRIVIGLFWLVGVGGAALLLVAAAAGAAGYEEGPPPGGAGLGILLALPVVVTAWGMGQRLPWSRWTGIALCLMALPFFPLGTLPALFALATLLSRHSTAYFGTEFF